MHSTEHKHEARLTTASRPLKVLMTADTVGGVWTYVIELCNALPAIDFTVATMGPLPSAAQREQMKELTNVELVASEYRLEWMQEPWRDVEDAGHWLREIAERIRPDLVHLNGYSHAVLDFAAPVISVAHSCVLSWWRAVHGCDAPEEWAEYKNRVAAGLHAAKGVVAPSRAFLTDLEDVYGPLPRSRVIHNGSAIVCHSSTAVKKPLIIAAGRCWDAAKNISVLADAATRVPWPIAVAGSASKDIPSTLDALGELPRTTLLARLGHAAIFVSPALYEPFGYGVLEAASQGCALVLADILSFREVWGEAAIYVPPRNSAAIGGTLAELIDSPERLIRMGQLARARSVEFSPARMGRAYLDLYREFATADATSAFAREDSTPFTTYC